MVKTADVQLGLEGGDKGLVLHFTLHTKYFTMLKHFLFAQAYAKINIHWL